MTTYNDGIQACADYLQVLHERAKRSPHYSDQVQFFRELIDAIQGLKADDSKPSRTDAGTKAS